MCAPAPPLRHRWPSRPSSSRASCVHPQWAASSAVRPLPIGACLCVYACVCVTRAAGACSGLSVAPRRPSSPNVAGRGVFCRRARCRAPMRAWRPVNRVACRFYELFPPCPWCHRRGGLPYFSDAVWLGSALCLAGVRLCHVCCSLPRAGVLCRYCGECATVPAVSDPPPDLCWCVLWPPC